MKSLFNIRGVAAFLILISGSISVANASEKIGTLQLFGKNGSTDTNTCQIPMKDGKVVMGKLHGCKNDEYYFFKIAGGQPGTVVQFYDSGSCRVNEASYRYVITGGRGDELNMTALSKLEHNGSTYELVEGNLETYGSPRSGRLYGKLSCVGFQRY